MKKRNTKKTHRTDLFIVSSFFYFCFFLHALPTFKNTLPFIFFYHPHRQLYPKCLDHCISMHIFYLTFNVNCLLRDTLPPPLCTCAPVAKGRIRGIKKRISCLSQSLSVLPWCSSQINSQGKKKKKRRLGPVPSPTYPRTNCSQPTLSYIFCPIFDLFLLPLTLSLSYLFPYLRALLFLTSLSLNMPLTHAKKE
ncbi:MAG: hypothetical protein JOS17DRAFT_29051 [Linnemannia elongata]|nr:MAG: hypothetical protein JOS17DRAFT_29051 [Linnemannia elongata]